jgi:hypothetical protein
MLGIANGKVDLATIQSLCLLAFANFVGETIGMCLCGDIRADTI